MLGKKSPKVAPIYKTKNQLASWQVRAGLPMSEFDSFNQIKKVGHLCTDWLCHESKMVNTKIMLSIEFAVVLLYEGRQININFWD